jgi:hypothetical protein
MGPEFREDEIEDAKKFYIGQAVCTEHDMTNKVGKIMNFFRGPNGELCVDLFIDTSTPQGKEAMRKVRAHIYRGVSISFGHDIDKDGFSLTKFVPLEISLVEKGAMPNTNILYFGDLSYIEVSVSGMEALRHNSKVDDFSHVAKEEEIPVFHEKQPPQQKEEEMTTPITTPAIEHAAAVGAPPVPANAIDTAESKKALNNFNETTKALVAQGYDLEKMDAIVQSQIAGAAALERESGHLKKIEMLEAENKKAHEAVLLLQRKQMDEKMSKIHPLYEFLSPKDGKVEGLPGDLTKEEVDKSIVSTSNYLQENPTDPHNVATLLIAAASRFSNWEQKRVSYEAGEAAKKQKEAEAAKFAASQKLEFVDPASRKQEEAVSTLRQDYLKRFGGGQKKIIQEITPNSYQHMMAIQANSGSLKRPAEEENSAVANNTQDVAAPPRKFVSIADIRERHAKRERLA